MNRFLLTSSLLALAGMALAQGAFTIRRPVEGAKVRETPAFQLEDPQGLLKWLAKDRALMNFAGIQDVKAHETAIQAIVRQWIAAL